MTRTLLLFASAAFVFAAVTATLPALLAQPASKWSPALAAKYLDQRQEQWFAWKPAQSANGPCVSCHTGMTYLLARPVLRRALGEKEPTSYEVGLLNRLRANVGAKPPGPLQDVEAIFAALFLAEQDAKSTLSADTRKAFDQLWTLQQNEGATKGAWRWYAADLDPWENAQSSYYGASLAALAVGTTPGDYQAEATTRDRSNALTDYLVSTLSTRRLHDRLALLWASSKRPALLPSSMRTNIVEEVFKKQQADGGWPLDALGPWMPHPNVPITVDVDRGFSPASDSYATGFTAFVLTKAGIRASHPGLAKALAWLNSHQDSNTGAWAAQSMNKVRPAGSMEALFMQDAATAFASLALIEAGQ